MVQFFGKKRVVPTLPAVQRALDLLTIRQLDELPVVDEEGRLLGVVERSDMMLGYTRRLAELRKG